MFAFTVYLQIVQLLRFRMIREVQDSMGRLETTTGNDVYCKSPIILNLLLTYCHYVPFTLTSGSLKSKYLHSG